MANHKIPFAFPKEVIEASEKIDTIVHEDPKAVDLRAVTMVIYDGEDAKDLDDAVKWS